MKEKTATFLTIDRLTVERPLILGERGIGLRNVSIEVGEKEIVVLAGESGSGKSLLCHILVGLRAPGVKLLHGEIQFGERSLTRMRRAPFRRLRRSELAMIGRDVADQFNPDRTVRQWLHEAVRLSKRTRDLGEEKKWSDFFYSVGIVEPERILARPMRDLSSFEIQRLMLMRAIMGRAKLIVCDQPTAELDTIAEAQWIDLILNLKADFGVSFLIARGSLRGADRYADRIAVFYEGGILEQGSANEILTRPQHLYTREFMNAAPRITHLPRELPTISREAILDAEKTVHGKDTALEEIV